MGAECCGLGASTARNMTGDDFQPNGVGGTDTAQGVSNVKPSAFFSSNTIPGPVFISHSCHWAIAIHSVMLALPSKPALSYCYS